MKNLLLITFLVAGFVVQAQSNGMPMDDYQGGNPADSVSDAKLLRSALRILREFRIQAYVQVEWQRADSGSYEPYGSQGTNYVGSAQGVPFRFMPTIVSCCVEGALNFRMSTSTRKI